MSTANPRSSRWKLKLGKRLTSASPLEQQATVAGVTAAKTTVSANADIKDQVESSQGISERLWNQVYDDVRTTMEHLVDTYEKILSCRMVAPDSRSMITSEQRNLISKNSKQRSVQMQSLVEAGLERTKKAAAWKQKLQDGTQVIDTVASLISQVVPACPQAAVAWAGLCLILEIFTNPLKESNSNRQGIRYVAARMNWYWNLSDLLLKENRKNTSSEGLKQELENHITMLYEKLLQYQMESVCYYYRNKLVVVLRDLLNLENWTEKLHDLQEFESNIIRDSKSYNTLEIRFRLDEIAVSAESQNAKLDSIGLAIRDQTVKQEQRQDSAEDKECRRALRVTDPRDDKKRIEDDKGGLLQDCYKWVLEHTLFSEWEANDFYRILWISGDLGQGKTMLLCGLINESRDRNLGGTTHLAYFFCQASDTRINNAVAVLRGLIYVLIQEQPSLIYHLRKRYDESSTGLFHDLNAWIALQDILLDMLEDESLERVTLAIDALDECVLDRDRERLLDFILLRTATCARVKWVLTSRTFEDIKTRLTGFDGSLNLHLDASAGYMSNAVRIFTRYRVDLLAHNHYSEERKIEVLQYLETNAGNTFLWVALVCESLKGVRDRHAIETLKSYPTKLTDLYERIFQRIESQQMPTCASQYWL